MVCAGTLSSLERHVLCVIVRMLTVVSECVTYQCEFMGAEKKGLSDPDYSDNYIAHEL